MERLDVTLADGYHGQGKPADPRGICVHDTGSPVTTNRVNMVRLLTGGLTQAGGKRLPPPIYSYVIWPDGAITQIADERVKTNHAGRVMRSRLALIANDQPAAGRATSSGLGNGNKWTIGVAMCRMGADVPAHEQYESLVRLCADICARWAWRPWSAVVGHSELTRRKVDPQRVDMAGVRSDVAQLLKSGAFPRRSETPPPFTLVRRGARSETVGKIHDRLVQLGYMLNPGRYRGVFGPKTEKAVKKFQTVNGLKVDGIVGLRTWSRLRSDDAWHRDHKPARITVVRDDPDKVVNITLNAVQASFLRGLLNIYDEQVKEKGNDDDE